MSFTQIPNEAIDRMTELSAGALKLYLYLLRCKNQDTGKCNPSASKCAEAINVQTDHIYKLRRELAEKKWVRFNYGAATILVDVNPVKNDRVLKKTGANPVKNDRQTLSKITVNPVKNASTYKEEQYERTILSEQDEIPVAVAPGAALNQQECYVLFVELWTTTGHYEAPYQNKRADFVHLAKLLKVSAAASWPITRARFEQAARNYFATPQGAHTLADLATRFSEFYKSAFDKFGKPVSIGNGPVAQLSPQGQASVSAAQAWVKQKQEEFERTGKV